ERSDNIISHSYLFDPTRHRADFAASAELSDQKNSRGFPKRLLNEKIRHARFCRQPTISRARKKPESVACPGPATHDRRSARVAEQKQVGCFRAPAVFSAHGYARSACTTHPRRRANHHRSGTGGEVARESPSADKARS